MQLDELSGDGETETEAAVGSGEGLVALLETLEDERQEGGFDPAAGVAHLYTEAVPLGPRDAAFCAPLAV